MENLFAYFLLFVSLYFEVFLLVSFLERRRGEAFAPAIPRENLPRVAMTVPCFNEEHTIETTLRSLFLLEYPQEKLEIIVVDDGSTDNTRASIDRFMAHMPEERRTQLHVYHKENGGKYTAMNYALQHTKADLIGCLDADSVVAPDALLKVAAVFSDSRIAAVTPGIHVREPKTLLQYLQHVEYRMSIFSRYILAVIGSVFITPGPFSIFRADIVRELGGWKHGHSTEDMEMALRVQSAGHLIANAPKAIVHTSTPANLRGLFRQRVRWTYGWLRNAVDYRYMIGNRAFGNLGIIILPAAIITIFTCIYFFGRIIFFGIQSIYSEMARVYFSGLLPQVPSSVDLFYVNTSAMLFLVYVSIALVLVLICAGSFVGTGSRKPPLSTPLFLMFYSFLVPLWLSAAVVRALLRTGVQWR